MLVGLVGTVVPLLPGTTIILAAAVMHHLALGAAQSVSWWTLGGLFVVTRAVVTWSIFVSGAMGAKKFGATRWGAIGGIWARSSGFFLGCRGFFRSARRRAYRRIARRKRAAARGSLDVGHAARHHRRHGWKLGSRRYDRVVSGRGLLAVAVGEPALPIHVGGSGAALRRCF